MPYFIYVLQSLKDQKFYIGMTTDIHARLRFHNSGLQRSTRKRIPFRLMYHEQKDTKKEALLREREIKGYKCGNSFKKLINGSSPA